MIEIELKKAKTAELEAELVLYREAGVEVELAENLTNNPGRVAEIERLREAHGAPVKLTAEFLAENPAIAKGYSEDDVDRVVLITAAAEADVKRVEILIRLGELNVPLDDGLQEASTEELAAILEEAEHVAQNKSVGKADELADTEEGVERESLCGKLLAHGVELNDAPTHPIEHIKVILNAVVTAVAHAKAGSTEVQINPGVSIDEEMVFTDINGSRFTVSRVQNAVQAGRTFKDVFLVNGTSVRLTPAEYDKQVAKKTV